MNEVKKGIKTSELWYGLAISISGLALTYKIIDSEQAAAWLAFVGALIALAPMLAYAASRTAVKRQAAGSYGSFRQLIGDVEAEYPPVKYETEEVD